MGKKKKNADFQKVKFKVGKKLPKSANFTDTSFKSRSIVIREQLKSAGGAPVSKSKHTLQELLSQTRHYNGTVRQSAASSIQELIGTHPDVLRQNASAALDAALALCSDRESTVRAAALRLVGAVLAGFDEASAKPFFAAVGAHVCRALTHLSDSVRLDALQLFDAVAAAYPSFVATRASQLLTVFVDQISKAGGGGAQRRTLTVDPSSRLSEQRNRGRVLKRIRLVLQTLVDGSGCSGPDHVVASEQDIRRLVASRMYYFCSGLSSDGASPASASPASPVALDVPALAASLCPLLTEHWIETMPDLAAHHTAAGHLVKAMDISALESVPGIATLIWRLLKDSVIAAKEMQAGTGFVVDQGKALAQALLAGFPYASHGQQAGQRSKRKGRAGEPLAVAMEDQDVSQRPARPRHHSLDKAAAAAAAAVLVQQRRRQPPVVVLQPSLQEQLFRGCHHGLHGEHRAGCDTLEELRAKYYWPGMDGDATELLRTCRACTPGRPVLLVRPAGAEAEARPTTMHAVPMSYDGRKSTGAAAALCSGHGADGGSSAKQTTAVHMSAPGAARQIGAAGEPVSVDDLNVAISCYIGMLASCGQHCEPTWAKRVMSVIAGVLADSRAPHPRTVRRLLDAAYLLFQQMEPDEADSTKTFIQVFCDLFLRSIENSCVEIIMTMLQFIRTIALNAVMKPPPKVQLLAAALARPLVDLLKRASCWTILQVCGQPAATMLRDLTIRGLYAISEEDLASCLGHLLTISARTASECSQDDAAIYLRKLVDLVACSQAEVTSAVFVPLSRLLRLLNHCGATLSYCLHSLQDRYLNKGLINGVDFFSFMFTLLLDDPSSAECHAVDQHASGCAVDVELTDTWNRAQVVRTVLLQFPDAEELGRILNAFVGRVSARRKTGLLPPTCAALLLCAHALGSARSMPAAVLLALVAPPVLQKPELSTLSALVVDVLSSRSDVLGNMVGGLQSLTEHISTDDVTKAERVCDALTWLLRAMPARVLASAGVLSAVDEHLSAVGKAFQGSSTDGAPAGSAARSLWYELRRAKMEALARPAAGQS